VLTDDGSNECNSDEVSSYRQGKRIESTTSCHCNNHGGNVEEEEEDYRKALETCARGSIQQPTWRMRTSLQMWL